MLASWIQRRFDKHGPFTNFINGAAEENSRGTVRELPDSPRIMLKQVCSDNDPGQCNQWLGRTFEEPAKPYLEAVLSGINPVLPQAGVDAVARWAVKTLLLLAHPQTKHAQDLPGTAHASWPWFPTAWLPRIRNTGDLPLDLSLWMAVHSQKGSGELPSKMRILLPDTFPNAGDQGGGIGDAITLGLGLDDGSAIQFALAHHPMCVVRHPFEEAGLAVRLWPNPPASLDFGALTQLSETGWDQFTSLFMRAQGGQGVRPEHAVELRAIEDGQPVPFMLREVCLHPPRHAGPADFAAK